MKANLLSALLCITICIVTNAQTNTFPASGNAGINTLTPATPLQVIGSSRFGATANYGQFDDNGNLSFNGTSNYKVGANKYAFQFSLVPNYGLFFNSTDTLYEFRDATATPVFKIGADAGTGIFKGGVSVGSTNAPPRNGLFVSGKLGVGISTPDVKLHVVGGSEVTLANGGTIVAGSLTADNLAMDNNEIQARTNGAANGLNINRAGGNLNIGSGGIFFKSSNAFTGIGTTSPIAKLNVVGGSNITLADGGYIVAGESTAANLAFDPNEIQARSNGAAAKLFINDNGGDISLSSGAIFINGTTKQIGFGTSSPGAPLHITTGTDATLTGGGYLITGSTTSNNVVIDNNEIMARNNSAISTLYLNRDGGDLNVGEGNFIVSGSYDNVGIKTTPLSFIDLQVGESGNDVTVGVGNSVLTDAGSFTLTTNGNFRTDIDDAGALGTSAQRWRELWAIDASINTSDARDKTNIRNLNYGLKEIMKLRSVRFNWKDKVDKNEKLGLIAQELQKVLPEVVRDYEFKKDDSTGKVEKVPSARLGVMYADMIPVIIRGMQQQQEMIEEQNKKIETLTQLVNQLSNHQQTNDHTNAQTVTLSDASLEQNAPNPFNQTTIINYHLNQNVSNAFIKLTDMNGKTIKTIPVAAKGNGQVTVNAGELTSGTYHYSLYVSGRLIDTKKMMLTK